MSVLRVLLATAGLCLALPLQAADYAAGPGSSLGFTAHYQEEAFEGRFARFTPRIRFDPADLAGSRFEVDIALASVDTQNEERDDMLAEPEFFDSRRQPVARYEATRFRALGGDRYVADGQLTLNGVSHDAPLAFTWTAGERPELDGSATLSRLAFKVGTGDWADTGLLPDEVTVATHLVLVPASE